MVDFRVGEFREHLYGLREYYQDSEIREIFDAVKPLMTKAYFDGYDNNLIYVVCSLAGIKSDEPEINVDDYDILSLIQEYSDDDLKLVRLEYTICALLITAFQQGKEWS